MNVNATVVETLRNGTVVEFNDENNVPQRRVMARELVPGKPRKGDVIVMQLSTVLRGIEYSTIDLALVLGEQLPPINVRELEAELRRIGLWTRSDYIQNPGKIAGVVSKLRGLEVARIVKAARTDLESLA